MDNAEGTGRRPLGLLASPSRPGARRVHWAARLEAAGNRLITPALRRFGWRLKIVPYVGYGMPANRAPGQAGAAGPAGTVRVLGRLLLAPPATTGRDIRNGRGWRRFLAVTAPDRPVTVDAGGRMTRVTTGYGGYIDTVAEADLAAGWGHITLTADGAAPAEAPVRVVGAGERLGVVTDIDDTIMVTALPRPLLAIWNTFVKRELARRPVPGIAQMLRAALADEPDALVVYVSTGAWNVAPAIEAFLDRHGLPRGPLLLTDWGPTPDRWFRSGAQHKRVQLSRLLSDLPQLSWLLIGDDGQHDPELYAELAASYPERVRAVAIRELSPTEQLLSHGTPQPPAGSGAVPDAAVVEVRGSDGHALLAALRNRGVARRHVHRSGRVRPPRATGLDDPGEPAPATR